MADNSWLTALPVSGSGDLSVSVGGSLWTGRLDRSGQLTVSGVTFPALSCVLNCTQAGSVILESIGESSATVGAKVGGYVALQGVSIRSNLESLTFSFAGSDGDSDWVSGIQYSVDGGGTMLDSGESVPGDPGATVAYTAAVYVSVAEETSGVSRSGVLTVSGSGQTLEFTISQSAGVKTYGPVEILSLTAADVPASGGSVLSGSVSYRQTYGWNGATSGAGTITSGGSVSWSGGASGIGSLGTTVKERSVVGSPLVVTVALNDQVGSSSVDIYQAANVSTLAGISADTLSYDAIPVLGGSSSPYYSISGSYSYTSGSTSTSVIDSVVRSRMRAAIATTKSFAFVAPVAGFTIDSGTGVVSATETEQSSEKVAQVKMSVEYGGFSSSVTGTCLQPAGSVVYGTPTVALSYATAPAAGGTLRPVFSVTQPWGWNNDTDAGVLSYDLESLPDGSSVNFTTTAGTVGSKDGSITVPTKGTTESGVTTYATVTCAVTVNGVGGSGTAAVSQAANTKALTSVSIERNGDGAIVTSFTAAGGTASYKPVGVYTYASTSKQTVELSSEVTKDNWSLNQNWGSVAANPTYPWCSVVTINSRGTAIGNSRNAVLKLTVGGLSDSVTLTQEGNYVTSVALSGGTFTYDTVWAAGNSQIWPQQTSHACTFTYSSGSKTTATPSSTYGSYSFVVTYSLNSNKNGFSLVNPSNGILSVPSRGTTIGNAITSDVVTLKGVVTWTPNSNYNAEGTKTNTLLTTATCTQAANNIESYGIPTGRTLSVSDIPASGGTVSSGTLGGTITQTRTFSSGASDTVTNPTVASSNYSTPVSAGSKGTTVSGRTKVGTLTYSYVCNGKPGSVSADVYQEANARYDKRTVLHFDNFEGPASKTVGAAGGQVNLSLELVRGFTSGAEGDSVDVTNDALSSYSVSGTGFSISSSYKGLLLVANRGTTVGSERNGTVTGIWNGLTSPAIVCTQSANSATYGAVSISGGSVPVIPASGGSVSSMSGISASQTVSFTSGSSRAGSVSISYSSAVSAPSKGTTISNQTSVGTLTATARGEGSKTATKALTVYQAANTLTWNTPTISRTTPVSIAAGGGSNNVATGLTYSQSGQYSSGSPASANSGGSLSYSVVTAKTGFSISGSTVTVTNNTSTSARNGFVVRITLKLNGVTATKDITYNQAAGAKVYSTPSVSLSYPTVPYDATVADPTISYSQVWTWNGVSGSGGTITSGGSVTYKGYGGISFPVNSVSGRITWGTNSSTSERAITVEATVTLNGKEGKTSVTAKQLGFTGPVDIYITSSFNYATSQIQINFSSAPKDTFWIKFMGYDQFGSIWEYTTGFSPSALTSFQVSPPGYNITDQFSIEGIGPTEWTISPTSPYETANARYYWSSGMITEV